MLERLDRKLARRLEVVGTFPNVQAVLRLLGSLLEEQQDEREVERRYLSQALMSKLKASANPGQLTGLIGRGGA